MKRYVAWIDGYKRRIVIVIPLAILALAVVIKDIAFEGGYRIWFAEDSQAIEEYDAFKQVFGSDDLIVIVMRDEKGVFREKALASVARITEKLWETPYIERVISLTNVPYIQVDSEDPSEVLVEELIPEVGDAGMLRQKRDSALSEPSIRGMFVSADGKTAMITARVVAGARDGEDHSFEIRDSVQKILDGESARTGYTYHLNGAIAIQTGFTDVMISELMLYVPLIAAAVALMLFFIYRRLSAVLVPMAVVGLSILPVMSLMVLAGYKINNFTADLPVFILAIGLAATVHLYTTWQQRVNEGDGRCRAVAVSLEKNMLAIFLTSLTTAIGFASLAVSDIVPVYTLGLATAGGVMTVFVLGMVLMPAMLLLVKPEKRIVRKRFFTIANYGRFIVANDRKIMLGTLLLFGLFAAGLSRLHIDSNLIRFLDEDVKVRQATEFIMKELTGPMSYEVVVDSKKSGGIKTPAFLNDVSAFSVAFAGTFPEARHVSSLLDVVRSFNRVMHGDDAAYYRVPESSDEIAQYLLLYSLSLPAGLDISDSMDVEERYLRIHLQTDMAYSQRDLEMIAWAERWWREHTSYSAKVYGQTAMFARMQSDITDTLLWSMGMSMLLVSLVMVAVFRNARLLYVYILPNVLPFVLVLGIMGWLGIYVDLGVAISGAVILGIAVDDTMHFLVKYFEIRKKGVGMEAALDYVMAHTGQAIMITTLILSMAFLMLTTSDFIPNAHFGLVTASALLIAVAVDLLFLPALLSLRERAKVVTEEAADQLEGLSGSGQEAFESQLLPLGVSQRDGGSAPM